jgi:hypothetical protein
MDMLAGIEFGKEPQTLSSLGPGSKRLPLHRTNDPLDQDRLQKLGIRRPSRQIETIYRDIFSVQRIQDDVIYRRADRVIVNENGAFIPRSLFPPNSDIDFRISNLPDGGISVNVFSVNTQAYEQELLTSSNPDRTREMQWLTEHRVAYVNQWVALDGDQLLSSGENAREVYVRGREAGIDLPFIVFVEPLDTPPFGGW